MINKQIPERKNYISPQLIVKGNIAVLTQELNKKFGPGDGVLWITDDINVPIQNYS